MRIFRNKKTGAKHIVNDNDASLYFYVNNKFFEELIYI